jgi:hypothetical protein
MIDKNFNYPVRIDWNNQSVPWWNECCAQVLEVFGLPGSRFMFRPHTEYMIFEFSSEKDQKLCQILLSEKL